MPVPSAASAGPRRPLAWALGLAAVVAAGGFFALAGPNRADEPPPKAEPPAADPGPVLPAKRPPAPDLDGGVAWLNSAGPLTVKKDLKGKVVVLDFWTLCCINCIHILPDLHKLEQKYPNELVVIGVHSPKFDNEKETASIKKAVARYEIKHPVVNDANRKIWERFEVESWPTFVVIDPEGNLVGYASGEGNLALLDAVVAKLIAEAKAKKTLNETPIRFDLAKFREQPDTPLFFPGKVVADAAGKRLAIADSTHHRVVITDLDGKHLMTAGTGVPGFQDANFDNARFDDPQGLAFDGDTLYVADRKNHSVRAVDLRNQTVRTVAGNGRQEGDPNTRRLPKPVPATSIGLNSPWDLLLVDGKLYIAMAGHHQLWVYDPKAGLIAPFAGNGRENIGDGPPGVAMFAQPSGLASDGKFLYVADSEVSALRKVPLDGGPVDTLVGRGLFVFGDRDGPGRVEAPREREAKEARLQHALGVAWADGQLYVADTYNSKLKVYDPKAGTLSTFLGGTDLFNEPAGLSAAGGKLYVADTNAHRVRVVDLATKRVETLTLKGVGPPKGEKK
ncbi:MAG: redoxin domain-containing protein [Gemmataceae bacterium]|nr:redoxin domain-containing protein [Gemmataceae bacterium]